MVHAATALLEMYGAEQFLRAGEVRALREADGPDAEASVVVPASGSGEPVAAAATKIGSIEAFYEAYSCMSRSSDELLKKGLRQALDLQRALVKRAAAMMDGRDSIMRYNRLYYAYLRKTASSGSRGAGRPGGAEADLSEVEHTFGRALVLSRLGQFIMDVKVLSPLVAVTKPCASDCVLYD